MRKSFSSYVRILFDFARDKRGAKKIFALLFQNIELRKKARHWVPKSIIPTQTSKVSLENLCIHVHLFHADYLPKLQDLAERLPNVGALIVTSPFEKLLTDAKQLVGTNTNIAFVPVENQGRNFGALFQIQNQISKFKYVLHLHSKTSSHMSVRRSMLWSSTLWNKLSDKSNLLRIVQLFESRPDFGLAFPELTAVLPRSAYSWGNNRKLAQALFPEVKLPEDEEAFAFPVGGMFVCKTEILTGLFKPLGLADFPAEPLAIDGSIAHALERLVAVYAGFIEKQIVVITEQDLFTTDTDFIHFKGRWG